MRIKQAVSGSGHYNTLILKPVVIIFGLWLNENDVVIQAVLGPGRNCRRTATSFFQDEQYLNRVGGLLIRNEGLCLVGSWHSHTMNIPDPSRDDKDTVWRYLPTPGRFVLLIATIEMKTGAAKVQMGFNLFESTSEGNKVISTKLELLQGQSPIRANKAVNSQMLEGAEVTAEVHYKRRSYPEPQRPESSVQSGLTVPEGNQKSSTGLEVNGQRCRKPDMQESPEYNDGSRFFKGQESSRWGDGPPLQQYVYCDGRPYNTSPCSDHSTLKTSSTRRDPSTPETSSTPKDHSTTETSSTGRDHSTRRDHSTLETSSTPKDHSSRETNSTPKYHSSPETSSTRKEHSTLETSATRKDHSTLETSSTRMHKDIGNRIRRSGTTVVAISSKARNRVHRVIANQCNRI
jgi:hypothetical protein